VRAFATDEPPFDDCDARIGVEPAQGADEVLAGRTAAEHDDVTGLRAHRGFLIPVTPITPPVATSTAVIHIAIRKPGRSSLLSAPAIAAPTTAIPSRPATRATALLTPLAIPASRSPASARTVEVRGATIIERPIENRSSHGSRSRQ